MICSCGGLTRTHETKHAYVHTCNGCGRRHEIPKEVKWQIDDLKHEGPVIEKTDWIQVTEIPKERA